MRIIFMGTPEFAVASLDALLHAGFNIVAVVTAPDKPSGRGQKLSSSAIKMYAEDKKLKVLQPERLKSAEFIEELRNLNADLQVVVAFRMLPEAVWSMPAKGTINLHGSLLPQYRGAAPINWAVINGEIETGATTFFLKQEIDTGDILFAERLPISENDSAGDVHDKLMALGAMLLVKTVKAIESGNYTEIPQDQIINQPEAENLKHAPKIFKDDCLINWAQPVKSIYNKIRGLSPYPTAYTVFQGKILKIYRATYEEHIPEILPGGFLSDSKHFLKFACADGWIKIIDLQLEGKKRMGIEEFLRGVKI